MNEKEDNSRRETTNQSKREISITDSNVWQGENKSLPRWKQVDIKIVELPDGKVQGYLVGDGIPYIVYYHAYRNLEIKRDHANLIRKRLTERKHFIKVSKYELDSILPHVDVTSTWGYSASVYYFLTEEGFNRIVMEIDTSRMKDRDIAEKIEFRKNEIAKVYTEFKSGKLVFVDSQKAREDVDRLGGEYEDHSFLNRLCIEITRKERTRNPHGGVMSEKEMFKEDFDDICGPIPFVTRWRNKLDKLNGKKLSAKKVFVIHEMLSKNSEKKSLRAAVIKTFEDICPDLMPDYMPHTYEIDTTRQSKLLSDGDAS